MLSVNYHATAGNSFKYLNRRELLLEASLALPVGASSPLPLLHSDKNPGRLFSFQRTSCHLHASDFICITLDLLSTKSKELPL